MFNAYNSYSNYMFYLITAPFFCVKFLYYVHNPFRRQIWFLFDEFLLNVCILQSFKKLNFFMFSSVINFTNSLTLKFFCTQAWYYCLSYITSFIRKSHTNAKIWMGMGMNWTFCFIVRLIQTNNKRNCCLIML